MPRFTTHSHAHQGWGVFSPSGVPAFHLRHLVHLPVIGAGTCALCLLLYASFFWTKQGCLLTTAPATGSEAVLFMVFWCHQGANASECKADNVSVVFLPSTGIWAPCSQAPLLGLIPSQVCMPAHPRFSVCEQRWFQPDCPHGSHAAHPTFFVPCIPSAVTFLPCAVCSALSTGVAVGWGKFFSPLIILFMYFALFLKGIFAGHRLPGAGFLPTHHIKLLSCRLHLTVAPLKGVCLSSDCF